MRALRDLRFRRVLSVSLGTLALTLSLHAKAATYSYVDWTAADVPGGTASGTITLPDNSTVQVSFAAINENLTAGSLYGAQINGGTNYWSPSTPYISTQVENAPPDTDILQLEGGLNQTYKVTLSEPIKDPIMAIVSLGQPGLRCTYNFDSPFTIVSQGVGYWGGSDTALKALEGNILEGYEGHGTIQFIGTFSTFSWTVPTPEGWHGFTFGIRTTERLEPSNTGGAGGGGAGGAADAAGASSGGTNSGGAPGLDSGGANLAGDAQTGGGDINAGGDFDAAGGATGTNGGKAGSSGSSSGGKAGSKNAASGGEGGADETERRATSRETGGCGCNVVGGDWNGAAGDALALLLVVASRRRRRAR